ncbi:MAG: methionine gamma-lyase family protein [Firmicutes bacterium]|nr:methionine gamma-lyase family protein [Bacillota bacterium]
MNDLQIIERAETQSLAVFKEIEAISLYNQAKVLSAFRSAKISYRHFSPTTGYGYGDLGKEALSEVFALAFGAEKAVVSPNIASGTHALTVALFGLLKPNDEVLSVTGNPYDTLMRVISGENVGSLKDFGIKYKAIELKDNKVDYDKIKAYLLKKKPKLIFITRSRGYSWREALPISEIALLVDFAKRYSPQSICFVDNCYGEFVEREEPLSAEADIIVGSLIKNPGGGLAPTGGYYAGKASLVDAISNRLTAPSLGTEVGSYNASYLPFFQGFFNAPAVVESALKASVLVGRTFKELGFAVSPDLSTVPKDIIRAIKFNSENELISFVRAVQYASPIDSFVTPYPCEMPGYTSEVIMASGTFIQGGSIELTADAPIREPYIAYFQGSLNYNHAKIALQKILEEMKKSAHSAQRTAHNGGKI